MADREEEAVPGALTLERVAAAERADKAELDGFLRLRRAGDREADKQRRQGQEAAQRCPDGPTPGCRRDAIHSPLLL